MEGGQGNADRQGVRDVGRIQQVVSPGQDAKQAPRRSCRISLVADQPAARPLEQGTNSVDGCWDPPKLELAAAVFTACAAILIANYWSVGVTAFWNTGSRHSKTIVPSIITLSCHPAPPDRDGSRVCLPRRPADSDKGTCLCITSRFVQRLTGLLVSGPPPREDAR